MTVEKWKAKGEDGKYDNRKNSWHVEDMEATCSVAAPITTEDGTVVAFAVDSSDDVLFPSVSDRVNLIAKSPELLELAKAALEWIDSVPSDIELPTMPGFDRDWAESVIDWAERGGELL